MSEKMLAQRGKNMYLYELNECGIFKIVLLNFPFIPHSVFLLQTLHVAISLAQRAFDWSDMNHLPKGIVSLPCGIVRACFGPMALSILDTNMYILFWHMMQNPFWHMMQNPFWHMMQNSFRQMHWGQSRIHHITYRHVFPLLQPDQINMSVLFWYFVKMYSSRKTRPCVTGHPVLLYLP